MRILFTFENALPSREADAEVFTTTAARLAARQAGSWLHVPVRRGAGPAGTAPDGLVTLAALAPAGPAVLRHLCCGLTVVARAAFREADLVYTRNLWVAAMALLFGQRVVFDHYRPWPDQIPPLQPLLRAVMGHRRFLLNICHSDYTRRSYLALGLSPDRQVCIRNGFAPERVRDPVSLADAKRRIGVPAGRDTVVYTGRVNGRKGLDLLLDAASRLPEVLFVLVGSTGAGPIEALAAGRSNILLVPWQAPDTVAHYLAAADVLVIPPSTRPLAEFGTTVLPLKLFLYMASGRPILAGATRDVSEVLRHRRNAFLCRPDCPDALADGLLELLRDRPLASRLAASALADSRDLTWDARAGRIEDAIERRLRLPPVRAAGRAPAPGPWLRRCGQWLAHAIRRRSIVLPPPADTTADGSPGSGPV